MYSEIYDKLLRSNRLDQNVCDRCITPISKINIRTISGCQECDRARLHIQKQAKLKGQGLPVQPKGNGEYDCLIGLSGGVDSSWLAMKLVEKGYKPLCIHVDNGWNTKSASANMFNLTKHLKLELHVRVLDWTQFSRLQKSFIEADVVDFELCSDHAIFTTLYEYSTKFGGIPIFQGINTATENSMPPGLIHAKHDARNIDAIFRESYGEKISEYPLMSTLKMVFLKKIYGIQWVSALDYLDYDKNLAEEELSQKCDYVAPTRKHEESLVTKIYQRIILPIKFNADKRIGHLSSLINTNLLSREDAIKLYSIPIYNTKADIYRDIEAFCGNLDISVAYFNDYLMRPEIPHTFYESDQIYVKFLMKVKNILVI
jgi:hypothetical protein